MILNRIIIILFITILLSSNLLWAGDGQLDKLIDSNTERLHDVDSDVLHHLDDEHHDGHDCHMSAHLLGLNSSTLVIAALVVAQSVPALDVQFSTRKSPPPNKPPRA